MQRILARYKIKPQTAQEHERPTVVDGNESYIARVKPGQLATTVLDAYADWQIPAKVRTVIPTADQQKRR